MKRSINTLKKFDKNLLKIIVCPVSKKSMKLNSKKNELISKDSGLAYPIIDGIPILIIEMQENYNLLPIA